MEHLLINYLVIVKIYSIESKVTSLVCAINILPKHRHEQHIVKHMICEEGSEHKSCMMYTCQLIVFPGTFLDVMQRLRVNSSNRQRAEWRRRVRPTGSWERASFVWMWVSGMSLRAIARQTGASVTTVYRWIRRWQREGHVFTRTRGCKQRAWNTQTIAHHENACQTTGRDLYCLSQPHVPLNTQSYIDMTVPRTPSALSVQHSSISSVNACQKSLRHEGWGCLDGLAVPLALRSMARTHFPHSPLMLPEFVAVKDTHKLSLASFINYLQFHESIHQLQATTAYSNDDSGKSSNLQE